jgi:hypothetical protein
MARNVFVEKPPMAGSNSKAQEAAASVTSESLVFKTACLHVEAVHQRTKLLSWSWRQTIGVEMGMGSLYPHPMEA